MATKISAASGNFTGSIWATVDSTSLLDDQTGNTTLTTSYVASQSFTPGAITAAEPSAIREFLTFT